MPGNVSTTCILCPSRRQAEAFKAVPKPATKFGTAKPAEAAKVSGAQPVLFLYASQSGKSKEVAKQACEEATAAGYTATVKAFNQCNLDDLSAHKVSCPSLPLPRASHRSLHSPLIPSCRMHALHCLPHQLHDGPHRNPSGCIERRFLDVNPCHCRSMLSSSTQSPVIVVVCSSTGTGQAPDNGVALYLALKRAAGEASHSAPLR